ncbi:MFS transporter [Falsirhodobacter algicola]|uniref:MFS transporter n=1 Tax=Falsirhodobacter algicola TaxID=2692330 RepID=A0A8J8MSV5_9RHOB|nr:MFS transporter [Falsirhodobacter algicola]QUS36105.1 MFS transporter [Falsirhodobacter algicola]
MTSTGGKARRAIWGWYFFDWASQPYATLLTTFIFAPYMARIMGDGAAAQAVWAYGLAAAGVLIAVGSPLLGAVADRTGGHRRFLLVFSAMYVLGAAGLWWAEPGAPRTAWTVTCFAIGLVGMEYATTFTNAVMPRLAPRAELGRISGSGWAFGYAGGVIALVLMLVFLQEGPDGRTLAGLTPAFGLDPARAEGTRAVGPFTALWYALFILPFFVFTKMPPAGPDGVRAALRGALPDLRAALMRLRRDRRLGGFLLASMLYRDALNGIYAFGGIYAVGVLGWEVRAVGIFGILAAIAGAAGAWAGGRADRRFGPQPVIMVCLGLLTAAAAAVPMLGPERILGLPVAPLVPTAAFYAIGALIGAAGGAAQAASRTLLIDRADPARITEAFGLFALSGKATAFLAPLAIGIATQISGSQQIGVLPVIALFLAGLGLLWWSGMNRRPHR